MAGYIKDKYSPLDWLGGSLTGLEKIVLQENGDWTEFLPVDEFQREGDFDSYSCVTFSALNTIEILEKRLAGYNTNYSDRFTSVKSGTSHEYGNSPRSVFDSIREVGLVLEENCPWENTVAKYFAPIDSSIDGKAWLGKYALNYEYLRAEHGRQKEMIAKYLKYSPLQVSVKYAGGSGVLNPIGGQNHFVTLYGIDNNGDYKILDHYGKFKKIYSKDYLFGCIVRMQLTIKNEHMPQLENNQIYMLVEGPEQKIALARDGKFMIYDKDIQALLNSAGRLKGMKNVKVTGINKAGWDAVDKINSKGEPYGQV